ncbi:hypothetical protein T265_08925 [Opisthorchis viverrini]|uniref:Uncharacterized protein n=1 Tax=Opisthorchis viverrini TaxID=6198 RepID=A0A074ZBZ4_OPIVI|nr:hypothetical protein T265_08925 [Opisthorchis viverrini]KER23117.1 hypothetical protein T265_08925 [Opisthorchis viverrini]
MRSYLAHLPKSSERNCGSYNHCTASTWLLQLAMMMMINRQTIFPASVHVKTNTKGAKGLLTPKTKSGTVVQRFVYIASRPDAGPANVPNFGPTSSGPGFSAVAAPKDVRYSGIRVDSCLTALEKIAK